MQLRYLETENFLTHRKEGVAFPASGIFLLTGESGAGKSSFIVDAVAYALYGVVATRARKGSDLLHHLADGEGMSVKATFDFADGRRITVARGLDARGSSWAQLYQPDPNDPNESEILAEGAAPVGQAIRRELGGMTWQQFHAAFVARQSEISMLTSLRGAERKALVQRMLGMRELEKAGELLGDRLRRSHAEREQLEKAVGEFDLAAEQRQLKEEEDSVARSRERVESLRGGLQRVEREQESLESELKPLRQAAADQERYVGQKEEIDRLESSILELQRAQEAHQGAEEAQRALPGLEEALQAAERDRDQLRDTYRKSKELVALVAEHGSLQEEVELGYSAIDPFPGDGGAVSTRITLTEARQMAGVAASEKALYEKSLAEKSSQIERLQEGGECYVCQRPFADSHDHQGVLDSLAQEEVNLRGLIEEHRVTTEWFAVWEKELALLEGKELRLSEVSRRIEELRADGSREDLNEIKEQGRVKSAALRDLEVERAELQARAKGLDPDAEASLEKSKGTLVELKRALPESLGNFDRQALDQGLGEERKLLEKAAGLRGQIPEAQRALAEAERALEVRQEALAGRQAELRTLDGLRREVLRLESLGTYLKAYGKHLAHEIRPALEEIGSEMIRRVSGGKHVAMHIDDDYEIELEERNGQRLKASMISGGESIRANICLRLALTRLVTQRTGVPVAFLIFDEPLPSQDPGHIERIMELLESLRPFYPQQFLISHVGELRSRDEVDYLLEFGGESLQLHSA
jgi:exonuclease SbcC